jgi:hypothetical protein
MDIETQVKAADIATRLRTHDDQETRDAAASIIDILLVGYVEEGEMFAEMTETANKALALAQEASAMLRAVKEFAMLSPHSTYTRALMEMLGEKVPDADDD